MVRDEADLIDAIELIYDAALDPGTWDKALHRCCQLLDGAASQIYGMDLASRDCVYQIDHGLTQQYKQEFALHFSRESERNVLHQTRPDIDLSYDYMMHDEQAIDRHPAYRFRQDYGFRYYVGAVLSRTPDVLVLANVQRGPGQGHVTETEISTFRLLKGHLARAVEVSSRLADLDMRERSAWEAIENSHIAVITLGHNGRVRRCNRAARRIINAADGMRCEDGMLKAHRRFDDSALQAMIASALADFPTGTGGNMAVARAAKVRPYSVTVMPIPALDEFEALTGDHVLVLLNDPDGTPEEQGDILRRHYGLTRRQSELTMMLAGGRPLGECAEALGIAERTARRHLETIFAKTGLHRQVDLVRLVLSLPPQPTN
jgi:DNA-binding CsgD family transcriptional regulator/PAS domain-containing protein